MINNKEIITASEFYKQQSITDANSVIDKNAHKYDRSDLVKFATAYHEAVLQNEENERLSVFDIKCECKKEWLSHSREYNTHPYGDNIEYDRCHKCGRISNFKVFKNKEQ